MLLHCAVYEGRRIKQMAQKSTNEFPEFPAAFIINVTYKNIVAQVPGSGKGKLRCCAAVRLADSDDGHTRHVPNCKCRYLLYDNNIYFLYLTNIKIINSHNSLKSCDSR